MGKYFLWGTVAFIVIILGALIYPTVHLNISSVDTTGFIDLVKVGLIILSYGFIPIIIYLVWVHVKKS